jgi:hypothetical protein
MKKITITWDGNNMTTETEDHDGDDLCIMEALGMLSMAEHMMRAESYGPPDVKDDKGWGKLLNE